MAKSTFFTRRTLLATCVKTRRTLNAVATRRSAPGACGARFAAQSSTGGARVSSLRALSASVFPSVGECSGVTGCTSCRRVDTTKFPSYARYTCLCPGVTILSAFACIASAHTTVRGRIPSRAVTAREGRSLGETTACTANAKFADGIGLILPKLAVGARHGSSRRISPPLTFAAAN